MSYGYSKDLREKALAYYDRGHSRAEVCDVFGVHRHSFASWLRLREEAGDVTPRAGARRKRPHKIDPDKLRAYLAAHPDAYLIEIGRVFKVSDVAILKACRRLGLTRKKNRPLRRA